MSTAAATAARLLLPAQDLARIDQAVGFVRSTSAAAVVDELLPRLSATERAALAHHCAFLHAAVLVFPDRLDGLPEALREHGLDVDGTVPSVVVRERLARRHGVPEAELAVEILHARVPGADGRACEVEIFALAVPPGSPLERLADAERLADHEAHLAFEVDAPDSVVLAGLQALLVERAGATPDGGGYNAHEDATALYFRTSGRRLELRALGHHARVLATHLAPARSEQDPDEAAVALLRLTTGAWATQAIAVAAELGLADHLHAEDGATAGRLAELAGADPDALLRLLRYLAGLGLVVTEPGADRFRLTEPGRLLRADAEGSLRPLALLYGGPFYESFGGLLHAVRTGRDAFAERFGRHHFDHFAADPRLADLFDRSMAASARMFTPVPALAQLGQAREVVDVGGGNGALLRTLLRAEPHLRGVLLERPHALAAARLAFAEAGLADRCRFVAGDFTAEVPPDGDVYVLSRVLHDWDDDQCLTILRRCAAAAAPGTRLLVVERLLPEDGTDSLALPWDVHMLCNVGGRERTEAHYARLLAASGFRLTARHPLPLDAALLCAVRTEADPGSPGTAS